MKMLGLLFYVVFSLSWAKNKADVTVKDLQVKPRTEEVFKISGAGLKKTSLLFRLKANEVQKNFSECAKLGPRTLKEHPDLAGWIYATTLSCHLRGDEKTMPGALNLLRDFKVDLLDRGPWVQNLRRDWAKLLQREFEKNKKIISDLALKRPEYLPEDFESEVLGVLQSTESASSGAFSFETIQIGAVQDEELQGLRELEALWSARPQGGTLKVNQNLSQIFSKIISFLNKHPGGREHKQWRDRLLEVYNFLWDARKEDLGSLRKELLKASGQRRLEFAQNFHRRANYKDALEFAGSTLNQESQNPLGPWIAGRSSLFLGRYEGAKIHFQLLIEKFSQSEEAQEARFRLGLLHFRLGNSSQALRIFEEALQALALNKKTDLPTRYWWLRSLEAQRDERAASEKKKFLEEFPWTYYGFRLALETFPDNQSLWGFLSPENENLTAESIFWGGELKTSWQRFKVLAQESWWVEASQEAQALPSLPTPEQNFFMARVFAAYHQWPAAIRVLNKAFEEKPSLRSWKALESVYPSPFLEILDIEVKKRKLHRDLVLSLIRQESAFGLRAVSTSNAMGLMQMIPSTAQDLAKQMKFNLAWPEDMFNPSFNIPMGVLYVNQMLAEFQNHVPLALGAYNAGPTRLKLWLEARPDTKDLMMQKNFGVRDDIWIDELPWNETSFYIKAILRNAFIYKRLELGSDEAFFKYFQQKEGQALWGYLQQ